MKTPLFPLAVIAALLLSLPARADGKAGDFLPLKLGLGEVVDGVGEGGEG